MKYQTQFYRKRKALCPQNCHSRKQSTLLVAEVTARDSISSLVLPYQTEHRCEL